MIPESNLPPEESLRERLEADPADWNTRLQIACLLYDQGALHDASVLIWEAERIPPCTALDLAAAACILAKDQPGKAIRLLTAVLENNRGKAAQNMGMANALLHHGMILQSARFYGAALEINPKLVNLEFEHFFVWADDEQSLWGDFQGSRPQLHELPWMTRDPQEASELTRDVSRHSTPIAVPRLNQVKVEASTTGALRAKLKENPGDWDTRRTLAQLLHDQGAYGEAAVLIWDSDPIPSIDLDIAFAARALAREQPRKAIRLLTAVFEQNRGKAVQNMGMANALLHHGMVLGSARFYGGAIDVDPKLVNPDLEHFLLWTDDAGSLWENFLKIRPPLGIFPWAQSHPTLDFGAPFSNPPIQLSVLKQVQGEKLTNALYQQMAGKNARITPPPSVTFPADRVALNDRADEKSTTSAPAKQQTEQEARTTAAAKRLAGEEAAAEAKAASLFAEAAESAKALIEQARQEATSEVAAIRAKAQQELQAALEQARRQTEQEMAAIRAKAREEAEEAAAQAEAAAKLRAEEYARAFAVAKQRIEEEERFTATAKRLAEEQAKAAAEQAAAAQVAAEKAREEATSEVAAMRAKAQEELKATLEQARQDSEQELAAIRAKARKEAESEAARIRAKAEEDARAAEKARLEAAAQAEATAKLRAEEDARALALAKQRAEEEERSTAAAKRLAEERATAAAEKIRQEAAAEVSALRAKAQDELKAAMEQTRRDTEQELAAIRAKAEEAAEKAAAAAEQARLEAAAQQQARLDSEEQLKTLRAKAREESKALMESAAKEAASEVVPISHKSETVASAAAVTEPRTEQERAIPVAGPVAKEPPPAVEKARVRQQETTTKRRFCVFLVSAAVALGVWQWIPGTWVDRTVFTTVASGSSNGALFISGQGSREKPWTMRSLSTEKKADKRQAPVIVSLGDDLKGFFQSSPPAPIDLAVIFSNFHRLGANKAATSAVFAWEKPDPIGLAAFEKSLGRFDSLVMAAPLARGVVSSPMPPALRRTSIPEGKIRGDVSALPLVNKLSISGIILGGETTLAGFSVLESEPPSKFAPLLARWEDRVIFSFSLLTVLQRLDLPLDGVEVRLGEFLKLGPAGPIVPIDESGHFALPLKPLAAYAEISAEALIDGGDDLFPKQAPDPVILRDDQTAAEPATQEFSRNLSAVVSAIASNQGLSDAREFPRLSQDWELGILAALVLALIVLAGKSDFVRHMGALVLVGACAGAQWIAFGVGSVWLPGLPMLAAIVCGMVVAKLVAGKSPEPASVSASPPVSEISQTPRPTKPPTDS